jgi:hypothetical protein
MQELRDTIITANGTPRPFLQEVDCISSVSGGSFTASYYALFRDQIFQDFETRFLRRNIQGELAGQVLNPVNWFRLMSPYFNRIDLAAELYHATTNRRRYLWAKNLVTYNDEKAQRPFLHLLDGGLADNIGLRPVADAYIRGFIRRRINDGEIGTLAIIVVNARTEPPEPTDAREAPPRLATVAMKTATTSMENFSFETVELMRGLTGDRAQAQRDRTSCQRLLDARCPGGPRVPEFASEVRLHVVEVSFEGLVDPKEQEFFLSLPTSFSLSDHQVDCLIAAGRRLLRISSDYVSLMSELGGRLQAGAERAADFPRQGCRAPN